MSFVRINISFARINIPFERIDIPFAQHIFFLKKILHVLKIPPSGKSYYYKGHIFFFKKNIACPKDIIVLPHHQFSC